MRWPRSCLPCIPAKYCAKSFSCRFSFRPAALAKACGVPRTRMERLANEEAGITADTALRSAKAFGTTTALWLNLQNDYDVQMAERAIGRELEDRAGNRPRRLS